MLKLQEAKKIMNYFGFYNENMEPILCQNDEKIGIFATFKTKYGYLSRFIPFLDKESMQKFLKLYLWYRNNINNTKMIVKFDSYETLSPTINFVFDEKEAPSDNLNVIMQVKKTNLNKTTCENEKIIIENLMNKINDAFIQIETSKEQLIKIISNYKKKWKYYNDLLQKNEKEPNINLVDFDKKIYEQKIKIISKNKIEYYEELLNILKEILLDETYLNYIYLINYYNKEMEILDVKIQKFEEYQKTFNTSKNKLFKNKKEKISFEEYIKNIGNNDILKNDINEIETIKVQKYIENIKKEILDINNNELEEDEIDCSELILDLNKYFLTLDKKQRNEIILLFSPIKELINLVLSIKNSENKLVTILEENYFLEKFREIYEILSNKDNYALSRKYLKLIKLDSLEEFIESIIKVTKNLSIQPFILKENVELKFKMGVIMKEGYVNASISDNYPINNRGANNYYISTIPEQIFIYYSPYVIKIDNENNVLAIKNNNIISFDISNLSIFNKKEIIVKNYIMKKGKNYKYNFCIFNEKKYINSDIANK